MLDGILQIIPYSHDIIITTSKSIAHRLQEYPIQTLQREEMKMILEKTRYAFMTPGL